MESLNTRTRGGGIAVITKQTVESSRVQLPRKYEKEACAVKISTTSSSYTVLAIYVAPYNTQVQSNDVNEIITYFPENVGSHIILAADFNTPSSR